MKYGYRSYLAALVILGLTGPAWGGKGYASNPDYPVEWPENIEEILKPDRKTVCDQYSTGNKTTASFKSVMQHIDREYREGDHRDFFFKYVLSMRCWAFTNNFFDQVSKTGNVSRYLGTIMKNGQGGVDPNAYIRLEREGKKFEGPLYHVFDHLAKNYRNSDRATEYSAVMRRLNAPARANSSGFTNASPAGYYLLYPVKSLEQIRREDPAMPINLP